MREYLRKRFAFRAAVLRVFPYGGKLAVLATVLHLAGLMQVAFIVATSAIVGRVPAAADHGLDPPEWRSLRTTLILAGVLFVLQQLVGPLQFTVGQLMAWRIDDRLRERAAVASFGPIGVGAELYALQAAAYG